MVNNAVAAVYGRRLDRRGSRSHVLFQDREICGRQTGDGRQCCKSRRRWGVPQRRRNTLLPDGVVIKSPEIKKLVLPDWTANLRTHNISIESGLAQGTLTGCGLIARIELAVLKIFIQQAVGLVRTSQ